MVWIVLLRFNNFFVSSYLYCITSKKSFIVLHMYEYWTYTVVCNNFMQHEKILYNTSSVCLHQFPRWCEGPPARLRRMQITSLYLYVTVRGFNDVVTCFSNRLINYTMSEARAPENYISGVIMVSIGGGGGVYGDPLVQPNNLYDSKMNID